MSQFRVWPFRSATIMTFGERNRNPGHHFAGVSNMTFLYLNDVQKVKSRIQKGYLYEFSIDYMRQDQWKKILLKLLRQKMFRPHK
jgi:hypothetical protein